MIQGQSEVAHTGESTRAAGCGSREGLGSRKFRSATIKVKSFEIKFIDCVDVFWVGDYGCRYAPYEVLREI